MRKIMILAFVFVNFNSQVSFAQKGEVPEEVKQELNAIELNELESVFAKSIVPHFVELIKAKGAKTPMGSEDLFGRSLIMKMRDEKVMSLTPEDRVIIKNKSKVEQTVTDVAYWKKVKNNLKGSARKNDMLMQAMSEYFSGLSEDSSVQDRLLLSKLTKSMKELALSSARTLEISKCKQVFVKAMMAYQENKKWVDYADLKIPDSLKFLDPETNGLMDWVIYKDAKEEPKLAFIVSPKPWRDFYIITQNDGSTRAVPVEEAREKYGLGK